MLLLLLCAPLCPSLQLRGLTAAWELAGVAAHRVPLLACLGWVISALQSHITSQVVLRKGFGLLVRLSLADNSEVTLMQARPKTLPPPPPCVVQYVHV